MNANDRVSTSIDIRVGISLILMMAGKGQGWRRVGLEGVNQWMNGIYIIMIAMRQKTNEETISGWAQGNETAKYIQVFPSSPLKRTLLPELTPKVPTLRTNQLPPKHSYNTLKHKPDRLPLKRLKSEIFGDQKGSKTVQECPSTRLFPSLPTANPQGLHQSEPWRRQEVWNTPQDKFQKYCEMEECLNLKLLENKSSIIIKESRLTVGEDDSEALLGRRRKHPLKMSTIEIVTKNAPESIHHSRKIKRTPLLASKLLPAPIRAMKCNRRRPSNCDLYNEQPKESSSKALFSHASTPSTQEDKCFSDQTIFPQQSSANLTIPMEVALPQRVRLIIKPK